MQKLPLPIGDFKWKENMNLNDVLVLVKNYSQFQNKGYLLCVDLHYPKHLQNIHAHFPLCPDTIEISFNDLSPYSKQMYLNNGGDKRFKCEKLIATFLLRKNYVLHIKNLQLYLRLGMELLNVHNVLEFTQRPFLKPYIELCTKKRQEVNSKFEKDLYKLLSNACYGKCIQNVRAYLRVKVHLNHKTCAKAIVNPTFLRSIILDENMVLTVHKQEEILLNKPIIVGQAILDYSKCHMYEFWYDVLLKKVPYQNIQLLFTDTGKCSYLLNY